MSRKQHKKTAAKKTAEVPEAEPRTRPAPMAFGFDEMLGELEAIVSDAETRIAQEAQWI